MQYIMNYIMNNIIDIVATLIAYTLVLFTYLIGSWLKNRKDRK